MIFFVIIFILSITSVLFLYKKEAKKQNITLLHYIQKSCNIDSVQFENNTKSFQKWLYKRVLTLKKISQEITKVIHYIQKSIIDHSKRRIRKKLFHAHTAKTSPFISEIKNNL